MSYRICKMIEVENGHMLSKHPANCKYPHGHSRRVELVLEADELDDNDMVCDFKAIKEAVRDFVQQYDHALCMNTKDPKYPQMKSMYGDRIIGFDSVDPTTEVMAKTIFDAVSASLNELKNNAEASFPMAAGVRLMRVRAWETSTCWAEYES